MRHLNRKALKAILEEHPWALVDDLTEAYNLPLRQDGGDGFVVLENDQGEYLVHRRGAHATVYGDRGELIGLISAANNPTSKIVSICREASSSPRTFIAQLDVRVPFILGRYGLAPEESLVTILDTVLPRNGRQVQEPPGCDILSVCAFLFRRRLGGDWLFIQERDGTESFVLQANNKLIYEVIGFVTNLVSEDIKISPVVAFEDFARSGGVDARRYRRGRSFSYKYDA